MVLKRFMFANNHKHTCISGYLRYFALDVISQLKDLKNQPIIMHGYLNKKSSSISVMFSHPLIQDLKTKKKQIQYNAKE